MPSAVEEVIGRFLSHPEVEGHTLAVGVSGGCDSMVLLNLLFEMTGPTRLLACHINHRLRGGESDGDARFVEQFCRERNIPFQARAADVRSIHAERGGGSLEEGARRIRYECLGEILSGNGLSHLVLAHHLDDQVETLFMRLIRGTGIRGLGCMQERAAFPIADPHFRDLLVWRPLLSVPVRDILQTAQQSGVPFREDSSNDDPSFLRNRIRSELLPLVDDLAGARPWKKSILDLTIISAGTTEFLDEAADRWRSDGGHASADFRRLPMALRSWIVVRQLADLGLSHAHDRVQGLIGHPMEWVTVSEDLQLRLLDDGTLERRPVSRGSTRWRTETSGTVNLPDHDGEGHMEFGHLVVSWRIHQSATGASSDFPAGGPNKECFDADRVGSEIRLRHWQAGDRFHPCGFTGPCRLKKWFSSQKVPRERRHQLVVAEAVGRGIFWIEGMRIAQWAVCRPDTTRVMVWNWRQNTHFCATS